MDKYYKLINKTLVYVVTIVLHLSWKWKWIEKHWKEDWIPEVKERMLKFWETSVTLTVRRDKSKLQYVKGLRGLR
jgi:hypothetical protein